MKTATIFAIIALVAVAGAAADVPSGLSLSVGLTQQADDFMAGAGVRSPILLGAAFVEASGWVAWRGGVAGAGGEAWQAYFAGRIGLGGRTSILDGAVMLYGSGGVIAALPNSAFTDSPFEWGGYGTFGIEIMAGTRRGGLGYYYEAGANGIGAVAEKQAGMPLYLNGWTQSVGLRYYFP